MVLQDHSHSQFTSSGGVGIRRSAVPVDYETASIELARSLNSAQGVLLASGFEYPGRYSRWDIGFVNPPVEITCQGLSMTLSALNRRGEILLPELYAALAADSQLEITRQNQRRILLRVLPAQEPVSEELRSRQPSVFTALRRIVQHFYAAEEPYLGLFGAFGYDLTFQFEGVQRYQQRNAEQRDLVLYLPDQITVTDHRAQQAFCYSYEFNCRSWECEQRTETTGGFRRTAKASPFTPAIKVEANCDHGPGEFERQVERALNYFRRGDLFEVVPGQTFFEPCLDTPADVFLRLQKANPAPYGALMNLGQQEYLVAASPEMFVRVEGRQIETCPISGTIKRGSNAIADAQQIRELLNSSKDESELSMCTDVDRNDKARVCEPGSVEVVGRRQIEMYSRLIHTVDHVKGVLREEFDALDGFLAHTWAVTVTGAPKLAAMQYIEQFEKSPRAWYGGAIGQIGFDGNLNTGLTLRTMRIHRGVAEVRAGATLLFDSDPAAEAAETRLKAAALLAAVRGDPAQDHSRTSVESHRHALPGKGMQVLMVDHQDSFVHNLAAYLRSLGVTLITLRPEAARRYLQEQSVDLVVLSPGPSRPEDFQMQETIQLALQESLAIFGVCLGLQGLVEYFGGSLTTLDYPMHGKASSIHHTGSSLFAGIGETFTAGRYHSLVAEQIPEDLQVTARSEEGFVMAVEHRNLPVSAVQFHPESIMSLDGDAGMRLLSNVLQNLRSKPALQGTA